MTFSDLFLFVVLPYASIGQLLPAMIYRARKAGSLAELPDGLLLASERRAFAAWSAASGAVVLCLLHLVPLVAPPAWRALIAAPGRLLAVEVVALAAGCAFLVGVTMLLARRLRAVDRTLSSKLELAALSSIALAALAGVMTALSSRWGSAWYAQVLVPYLYSLAKLSPDTAAIGALGFWPRAHVALGFLSIALAPFTTLPRQLRAPLRLVHARPAGGAA